ncbi:MAG TPA: peptidylprolyl isomerase [Steroidobacteraceae bacterium]|nr:peptidylprolyl isomerase [Steroidobacteraceae bacterium]
MRTQRLPLVLFIAGIALLAGCTKPAGEAAKPAASAASPAGKPAADVATVNGKPITAEQFSVFVEAVTGKPGTDLPPEQKSQMLDQLINMELASQAAEKEGLQNDAATKARIALLTMQVLAQAGTEKYLKAHPVSDSEVKAEYDEQVAKMPMEYKARHILVDSKEQAEAIIKQLDAGADFAKLAAKDSKDPSGKNGGDLGWFSLQSMVKPFSDAVAALKKGEITQQPVQTQYGWHVIQLEDTRAPTAPAFDDVKQQVKTLAERKKLQAYLDELRKTAKIQKTG